MLFINVRKKQAASTAASLDNIEDIRFPQCSSEYIPRKELLYINVTTKLPSLSCSVHARLIESTSPFVEYCMIGFNSRIPSRFKRCRRVWTVEHGAHLVEVHYARTYLYYHIDQISTASACSESSTIIFCAIVNIWSCAGQGIYSGRLLIRQPCEQLHPVSSTSDLHRPSHVCITLRPSN